MIGAINGLDLTIYLFLFTVITLGIMSLTVVVYFIYSVARRIRDAQRR